MAKILVADEPMSLSGPVVHATVEASGEPLEDAKSVLSRLAAVPGVALAVLVDREGFLIESAGDNVNPHRSNFLTHRASSNIGPNIITNPLGPIPDPFFLPGKDNPYPGFMY